MTASTPAVDERSRLLAVLRGSGMQDAELSAITSLLGAVGPIDSWPPIDGFFPVWATETSQLFTLYVVSRGRLLMHQRTGAGEILNVSVALSTVRRVAENVAPGRPRTVVIELDADTAVYEHVTFDLVDDPSGATSRTKGIAQRSGYMLTTAIPEDEPTLVAFATAIRGALGRQ